MYMERMRRLFQLCSCDRKRLARNNNLNFSERSLDQSRSLKEMRKKVLKKYAM